MTMDYTAALVLGIIQGIAEWLPISSEAMVTLAGKFLFESSYQEALGNAIWLHSGTSLSALVYFRNDIVDILSNKDKALLIFLLAATSATAVTALPLLLLAFSIEIPESLFTVMIGAFLVLVAVLQRNKTSSGGQEITAGNGIIAGLVQGFAVLPGLSRSGLTIAALISRKYSLAESLRLSFLMSIPVTAGIQILLPMAKGDFQITGPLIIGAAAAALVGLLTIKMLIEFAEHVNFSRATFALGLIVITIGLLM